MLAAFSISLCIILLALQKAIMCVFLTPSFYTGSSPLEYDTSIWDEEMSFASFYQSFEMLYFVDVPIYDGTEN